MTYNVSEMPPHVMFVARSIYFCDDDELLEWARSTKYLDHLAEDYLVAELFTFDNENHDNSGTIFDKFNRILNKYEIGIDINNDKSNELAKILFYQRMQEYLDGKCNPYEVCRMVGWIEVLFDYPNWLGDMYNVCDWIEPTTERSSVPNLSLGIAWHLDNVK